MFDKESYRIFEGDTIAGGKITGISLEKNNVLFEKDGEIFEYFAEVCISTKKKMPDIHQKMTQKMQIIGGFMGFFRGFFSNFSAFFESRYRP